MYKPLILVIFLFLANVTIAQTTVKQDNKRLYGPLPYRTLQETIGEIYITLPLMDYFIPTGYKYLFKGGEFKNLTASEGKGLFLKLVSIDDTHGFFIDSGGVKYSSKLYKNTFPNLAPLSDFDNGKKLLLNKPTWLNVNSYVTGEVHSLKDREVINNARFLRVMVKDVLPSYSNNAPLLITFKTAEGITGYTIASISGTNTDLNPEHYFNQIFFTEDPQVTYKLSPKTWAAVKAGRVELGMSTDAVRLIEGPPKKVNTTTTATGTTAQWVYGDTAMRFFYFTNGKVTSMSH